MAAKDELGRYGEQLAAQALTAAGFDLLARNWRCPAGEIDIVARDGSTLVVCEVKTRSSLDFGVPAAAVTPRKVRKLRELALCWLREHPAAGLPVRFDVVSVVCPPGARPSVEHLRGAF